MPDDLIEPTWRDQKMHERGRWHFSGATKDGQVFNKWGMIPAIGKSYLQSSVGMKSPDLLRERLENKDRE